MTGVLAVHPSDELYGADRVLLEVVRVLAIRGAVTVWLPSDVQYRRHELSTRLERGGITVARQDLPVLRREYLRFSAAVPLMMRTWRTLRAVRRLRPELVYLNTSAVLPVAPLARLSGARAVVHVHETWSRTERLLLGPLLWWCDEVIAVSAAVAGSLPGRSSKVTVVHNGVESERGPEARREQVRAQLGVGPDALVVLVASRWNRWKGHETLLRAWERLDRRDVLLVVLGGPPASGAVFDLVGAVERMDNRESVHVVGERDDIRPWIEASDLVVMPSTGPEPFGLVAVEAGALGVAVYASRTGGLPEIVEDEVTGRLIPAGDVDAWYTALAGAQRDRLAAQGAAGRRRYEEAFTGAAFSRRLEAALAAVGAA